MIIQAPLLLIAGFFTCYLFFLAALAFTYRSEYKVPIKKWMRFAIIIPAHNEELVISQTLKHLINIEYPYNLYDIIVIADNCTDKTAEISSSLGVIVMKRNNLELKGKGYALKWCFEYLMNNSGSYDAVVIIDADTIVSKNLLHVLNHYLNAGTDAIQCSDLVKPQYNSWSSEITRIGLLLYNYVKPLGKKIIKCSAGLRGNGMCFTVNLLKKVPWQAFSQTEDLEYGINLLMYGVSVVFAPEATVNAIMPLDPKNAETQRARWEIGRFPLIKKYSGKLLKASIYKFSFKLFDAFIDLITPAFMNLFIVTSFALCINIILILTGITSEYIYIILWSAIFILQILYVIGGLYTAKADKYTYKALLNVPKFAIWKLALYIKLAINGHSRFWIRTTRES